MHSVFFILTSILIYTLRFNIFTSSTNIHNVQVFILINTKFQFQKLQVAVHFLARFMKLFSTFLQSPTSSSTTSFTSLHE